MSFPPSHLSKHAQERVLERFKILPPALIHLLNAGMGKNIGVSAQTHLAHRLIWSVTDDAPLIAIQDVSSGTVLTVLTVEMYRNEYEPNLTKKRLRHVINQMVHAGFAPTNMWTSGGKDEYVTVYATLSTSSQKVALGRWRGAVESVDLSILGKDSSFWTWVTQEMSSRGHAVEELEAVSAKFSGGDLQWVLLPPQ